MSEYLWIPEQNVQLNQAAIFDAAVPCENGAVYHEDGSGVFVLQGKVFSPYQAGVEYTVEFSGNIAVPTAVAVVPIAIGIAVNGETRQASTAISSPTVVNSFDNVTSIATFFVPRGRTFFVAVRAVAPPVDLVAAPAASLNLRNANLTIRGQVINFRRGAA